MLDLSNNNQYAADDKTSKDIIQLLHKYGFGNRLITIDSDQLPAHPVIAEAYSAGRWRLCIITGFVPPAVASGKSKRTQPQPKVQVTFIPLSNNKEDIESKTIGVGDLTTIWSPRHFDVLYGLSLDEQVKYLKNTLVDGAENGIQQDFAVNHCEISMQRLYNGRASRNISTKNALSKKQIPKIAEVASDRERAEELLRIATKAGPGMQRVVDSSDAEQYLYADEAATGETILLRRVISAEVLSKDAQLGGRFKRMPCNLVAAITAHDGNCLDCIHKITFLNGGWLAVDSGSRAGAEARKLVERAVEASADNRRDKPKAKTKLESAPLMTAADERIVSRLECMAMGESIEDSGGDADEKRIEVDVREALRVLKLPVSASGAKDALIRMGRWTEGTSTGKKTATEPWPENALDAASSLAEYEKQRKKRLTELCIKARQVKHNNHDLEGRVDLSSIPSVCVDAKGTSFRDDAIGVRPRSITGRTVTAASKWEILVHISDVSDVFCPDLADFRIPYDPTPLRDIAERRGYSRYDLPFGPLHLMPPVALKALALTPANPTNEAASVNRCVTLWAYIDEKSGELLDAGLERSITSAPFGFTYAGATALLEGDVTSAELSGDDRKAKSILALVERNLSLWSDQQRQTSKAAAKRHERMAAKEIISQATSLLGNDGRGRSFQFSRGHQIVDSALDLYGYALTALLRRAKAPIPSAPGRGTDRRGRLGTAPLRRYVDAIAQRQALSVLCDYGGPPLTKKECNVVYQAAAKASDAINTVRSIKHGRSTNATTNQRQDHVKLQKALERLEVHLAGVGGGRKRRIVKATSTGRENEVVLEGIGVAVKCLGVDGSLKPGEKVLVNIVTLEPSKNRVRVELASRM